MYKRDIATNKESEMTKKAKTSLDKILIKSGFVSTKIDQSTLETLILNALTVESIKNWSNK